MEESSLAAFSGSSAPNTAVMTAMPSTPVSSTVSAFSAVIPPIANIGMLYILDTASLRTSNEVGALSGFVGVKKGVPKAT